MSPQFRRARPRHRRRACWPARDWRPHWSEPELAALNREIAALSGPAAQLELLVIDVAGRAMYAAKLRSRAGQRQAVFPVDHLQNVTGDTIAIIRET